MLYWCINNRGGDKIIFSAQCILGRVVDRVQEWKSKEIVATGTAELDEQVGEGILEWIQVSPTYRGLGLGTYIVTDLLTRIAKKAQFATVSGQINNPSKPENLYRKCGFQGNDIWHVLKKEIN